MIEKKSANGDIYLEDGEKIYYVADWDDFENTMYEGFICSKCGIVLPNTGQDIVTDAEIDNSEIVGDKTYKIIGATDNVNLGHLYRFNLEALA